MTRLKISIAMCTYNGERFLREQLDSIAAQTRLPDEVVVCDDGSTDDTMAILETWAKEAPFEVRIYQNEKNLGYAKNFEKAISLCVNDIIFISDQDDYWMPDKMEVCVQIFAERPDIITVYSNAEMADSELKSYNVDRASIVKEYVFSSLPCYLNREYLKYPVLSGCCCAIRSSLVPLLFDFSIFAAHDVCIYACSPLWGNAVFLDQKLIKSRVHENNVSRKLERVEKYRNAPLNTYKTSAGNYFAYKDTIDQFIALIEELPQDERKKAVLKFLYRHERHYTNRIRVQRNSILFSPIFIFEIISGRYFYYVSPVRSMVYDFYRGLRSVFKCSSWKVNLGK